MVLLITGALMVASPTVHVGEVPLFPEEIARVVKAAGARARRPGARGPLTVVLDSSQLLVRDERRGWTTAQTRPASVRAWLKSVKELAESPLTRAVPRAAGEARSPTRALIVSRLTTYDDKGLWASSNLLERPGPGGLGDCAGGKAMAFHLLIEIDKTGAVTRCHPRSGAPAAMTCACGSFDGFHVDPGPTRRRAILALEHRPKPS